MGCKSVLKCNTGTGIYLLIGGRLYKDWYPERWQRTHITSFCIDDPMQSTVVELPIFIIYGVA